MDFRVIDKAEYQRQLEYYNNYYGAEFKRNQGTEELLDMINKYSVSGDLIDFGSGSNIYFWLSAFNNIDNVKCVDISKEAFYINEMIKTKQLFPKSIDYPIKKYNKNYDRLLSVNVDYHLQDLLFNNNLFPYKANNVSQFGLLGLSKNKEEYISNFLKLYASLKPDGIFLGANWIFSEGYSLDKGYSNSYLNDDLIYEITKIVNGDCLHVKLVDIKNDSNYSHVLIYCIRKCNDDE